MKIVSAFDMAAIPAGPGSSTGRSDARLLFGTRRDRLDPPRGDGVRAEAFHHPGSEYR